MLKLDLFSKFLGFEKDVSKGFECVKWKYQVLEVKKIQCKRAKKILRLSWLWWVTEHIIGCVHWNQNLFCSKNDHCCNDNNDQEEDTKSIKNFVLDPKKGHFIRKIFFDSQGCTYIDRWYEHSKEINNVTLMSELVRSHKIDKDKL